MINIESENVQKMNKNMTAYRDSKTGKNDIKLSITLKEKEQRNGDLMEYLLDFGLAGKLEEQLKEMLDKNTEGYRRYKRMECGGRWTDKCKEFKGYPLAYCIVIVRDDDVEIVDVCGNRVDAIKGAGMIWNNLNELDKRRVAVEVRAYDDINELGDYDVIEWLDERSN